MGDIGILRFTKELTSRLPNTLDSTLQRERPPAPHLHSAQEGGALGASVGMRAALHLGARWLPSPCAGPFTVVQNQSPALEPTAPLPP